VPTAGGSQTMPRLVWRGMCAEPIITGEMISAAEALRIGLINKIVPRVEILASAEGMARVIMSRDQVAVRYAKEAINRGLDLLLEQGLEVEGELFAMVVNR